MKTVEYYDEGYYDQEYYYHRDYSEYVEYRYDEGIEVEANSENEYTQSSNIEVV